MSTDAMDSEDGHDGIDGGNVDELQSRVDLCKQALARLGHAFRDAAKYCPAFEQWQARIKDLQEQDFKRQTIIGVVGATGSGKSSLINAVVDEDRLVPTSCMSACTAVVTEISWNPSDDPVERYCAEVRFITAQEWKNEIENLLGDLLSGLRINISEEAELAWGKLHAVYPFLTKSDLPNQQAEDLLVHPDVRRLLGQHILIREATSSALYSQLEQYVIGRAEPQLAGQSFAWPGDASEQLPKMEHWPLIKAVKLYTKSHALSTGVVLVDLPGVQDSNLARAAVAQDYMKRCDALWIVAPITRAVNDKVAKNLLNHQFKFQMQMDDMYSHLTFVCSKTDDMSVYEMANQLRLRVEIQDMRKEVQRLSYEVHRLRMELQRSTMQPNNRACSNTNFPSARICNIEETNEDEQVAHQHVKKRKRATDFESVNRLALVLYQPHVADGMNESCTRVAEDQLPMSSSNGDLCMVRRGRSSLRDEATALLQKELEDTRRQLYAARVRLNQFCVQARNEYAKKRIRADFATGLSEQFYAAAMEDENGSVTPEREVTPRDYDGIAENLPVFCVSSRAYQQLSGQDQHDPLVHGFENRDQTEVPLLQIHCRDMPLAKQAASHRNWLNSFNQFLDSLSLWSGGTRGATGATARNRLNWFRGHLQSLEDNMHDVVNRSNERLSQILQSHVYDRLDTAAEKAHTEALDISAAWAGGPFPLAVGMPWSTYKATVRRNGVFSGRNGLRDFNQELTQPMWQYLKGDWITAFHSRPPTVLKDLTQAATECLKKFHRALEAHSQGEVINNSALELLSRKLLRYNRDFKKLADEVQAIITSQQRDANRVLGPEIMNHMTEAYLACAHEHGHGTYVRMRQTMTNHVTSERDVMFDNAKEAMKSHLDILRENIRVQLEFKMNAIIGKIKQDYQTAFDNQAGIPCSSGDQAVTQVLKKIVKDEVAKVRQALIL